jgi:hypothetical protein
LRVCDGENSQNGFGSFLMDFVSELSDGLSSLLISFVLICLACGAQPMPSRRCCKILGSCSSAHYEFPRTHPPQLALEDEGPSDWKFPHV